MCVEPDGLIELQAWTRYGHVWRKLFVATFFTLNEMSQNLDKVCNHDASDKTRSFLKLISSFPFIVSLVITRNVFDLTIDVTNLLN